MKKGLNLYAGLGGNRKLWTGIDVTAVEMEKQIADVYTEQFPGDIVVIGDAHKYLKENYKNFDFVWSSPPCQKHSKMMKATRHDVADYIDISLYQEIIFLTHFFKGLWVVENVIPYYKPLIEPTITIGRHCFWSNFKITPCNEPKFKNFIVADTVEETEEMKKWLGITYKGNIYYKGNHSPGQVLRNCVHPEVGLHIFNCAMNTMAQRADTQQPLFAGQS